MQKLEILTDAARFDVACTSSGVERKGSVTAFLPTADVFLYLRY